MKAIRDRFSGHSGVYKKYRPGYPPALYQAILEYTAGRENYWDCATGNGQVVRELASYFKQAYATDISKNQLDKAPSLPNVIYKKSRAENTGFEDNTFDLITVAQAIHWFDIRAFLKEARRVGRPDSVLAVWGYSLLRFGEPMDAYITRFYREVVGPYWDGERTHIDTAYTDIPFNLKDQRDLGCYAIEIPMDLATLQGYLTSWSSVQNYIRKHGINPVDPFLDSLRGHWEAGLTKNAVFPVFGTMGKIVK